MESELESHSIFQSRSEIEHSARSPIPTDTKTYDRHQYTVGIICPLAKELKAVRALFDNKHCRLRAVSGDSNHYHLGDMAGHWVVATSLPAAEYGTNAAASVASSLKCSFPSIRFCLLVGISGGVPSEKRDIRLGDVVVSLPVGTSPGVLQYDLGKEEDGNNFRLMGSLQRPPRELTAAISALQSDPEPQTRKLDEILHRITNHLPEYKHPDQGLNAVSQATCASCISQQASLRSCSHIRQHISRMTNIPTIHYGIVASGNSVIKDVTFRNQLGQKHDILCFEMEAAGVMNTVDCLVIRGISDYCDAQKNDIWQEYAAATAAAYAKLLLGVVA